jgi:kynurenine formamidase
MLIDLSVPIASAMPVYPGDPEAEITQALRVESDGVAVSQLVLGSHTGTHLDAPSHVFEGGGTLDTVSLDLLVGKAAILRVVDDPESWQTPHKNVTALIHEHDLVCALPERLPERVCLATGWDVYFGQRSMVNHPGISMSLAQELWARGARVLGVDMLSPDPTTHGSELPVHKFWLGSGGVIVENLTGLTQLPSECELSLLPLRLRELDGSPIRAIATV